MNINFSLILPATAEALIYATNNLLPKNSHQNSEGSRSGAESESAVFYPHSELIDQKRCSKSKNGLIQTSCTAR